jgi:hypothetical protein
MRMTWVRRVLEWKPQEGPVPRWVVLLPILIAVLVTVSLSPIICAVVTVAAAIVSYVALSAINKLLNARQQSN